MNNIPISHLKLSALDEGTYEPDSGIRINRRTLTMPTDLHWHEFFELEFVVSGKGLHLFNGIEYDLLPGSALILTPLDFHKIIPIDNLELCTIMFPDSIIDPDMISTLWSLDHTHRSLTLPPDRYDSILLLFDMLSSELKNQNTQKRYICNLTECIFMSFLRIAEKDVQIAHSNFNTAIHHALSYMHSNFRKSPSLSETAAISNYSPNYFSLIFKKITGKSYKKYLNDLKLNFSRQLIINSNLPLTEICYASGFESLSNFYRVYKAAYGSSPKSLRVQPPER